MSTSTTWSYVQAIGLTPRPEGHDKSIVWRNKFATFLLSNTRLILITFVCLAWLSLLSRRVELK